MKKKNYFVLIAVCALLISYSSVYSHKAEKSRNSLHEKKHNSTTSDFTGSLEHNKSIKNNIANRDFQYDVYYVDRQKVELIGDNKSSELNWLNIGPTDRGGRVRSIIFDKNNNEVMYAGAVSGGLWKTTNSGQSWQAVDDLMQSLIVSCIAQSPNGIIYFGTGEGFAANETSNPPNPIGSTINTGFPGMGLFKSTDATGTSFVQIESTEPTATNGWQYIYRLKIHNNGDIYAATQRGIRKSTDGGDTWTNPLASFTNTDIESHDIDISPNGNVITLVVGRRVFISTDAGVTYFNASTGGNTLPIGTTLSRIEIDIAPSNPNYIYASAAKANGTFHNIYRSTDGGQTWSIIGPGGSENFNIFATNQGYFSNVIKVHPTNPNKIFVGGLNKWQWEAGGNWEQKSEWRLSNFDPLYLHALHHEYVFHPQNPNIIYYGTNGGISKSTDGGNTFETVNRNFATIQSYAIAVSKEGMIMTGTQDNGTLLMDRKGFIEGKSRSILGGVGGYCSFSFLNPKLYFASDYFGYVFRTPTADSEGMNLFFDDWVRGLTGFETTNFASFITPFVLHEKINDHLSPDSVTYTHVGTPVGPGDIITVFSETSDFPFTYQLPLYSDSLFEDSSITVQDIVTSKFYLGINGYILMTRQSHNFAITPVWWPIARITGTVQSMAISRCGNYLFAGTTTGSIYRISNLNYANDYLSASALDITTAPPHPINPFCVVETKQLNLSAASNRPINNIAIDPNNPSRILICLGNYGSTLQFVFFSSNALDENPTFVSKQGTLPRIPVYSAIIELTNPNTVLLGTEYGVYMTTNIAAAAPTWTEVNSGGMARAPVYDLKQQVFWLPGVTNYGAIYAATHGRGIFETTSFVTVPETEKPEHVKITKLEVFPNPTTDEITFKLPVDNKAKLVRIFNISGKIMHQVHLNNAGTSTATINVSSLQAGTYIIEVSGEQFRQTGMFIKFNQ